MTTRQFLTPGLTEFAAACFLGGKNCQKGGDSKNPSRNLKVAQGLLKLVVNINGLIGLEK